MTIAGEVTTVSRVHVRTLSINARYIESLVLGGEFSLASRAIDALQFSRRTHRHAKKEIIKSSGCDQTVVRVLLEVQLNIFYLYMQL